MKKSIGMAVIVASVLVAPSVMAQEGMWEMSVAGNIENSSDEFKSSLGTTTQDSTSTFVNLAVGKYFTSQLVGRVNLSMFGQDSGEGNSSLGTAVGVGAKYYFGEAAKAQWVPFVEGGLDVVGFESKSPTTSTTYSGWGVVAGAGVSYFITEEVSGDLSLQGFSNTMSGSGVDLTQSGTRFLFGLTARY